MFYVYEWYVIETGEVFYVGKGKGRRKNDIYGRSKSFLEMYNRFNCSNRIVKEFSEEIEAFEFEMKRILELKEIGQSTTNNHIGGYGGCSKWTEELKKMVSKYNPMKSEKQRERMKNDNPMSKPHQRKRMSDNNPMKNKETAKIVGEKHRKPFYIGEAEYQTLREASKNLNVTPQAVMYYLKKGKTPDNKICRYKLKQDNQKPSN